MRPGAEDVHRLGCTVAGIAGQLAAHAPVQGVVAGTADHRGGAAHGGQAIASHAAIQRIVAAAADQRVAAAATLQQVVAGVAGDGVVQVVAEAVHGAGSGQHQVVEVGGERPGDGALHRVDALVQQLDRLVRGVVDHIEVVAEATGQRVGARAAVQRVVAVAAGQRILAAVAGDEVVQRVAGAVDAGNTGQHQVFDVGGERPADRGAHRVDALVGDFRGPVAEGIDHVGVVAEPTHQAVGAGRAVQRVVAVPADQGIGAGGADEAGKAGIEHLAGQAVGTGRADMQREAVRAAVELADLLQLGGTERHRPGQPQHLHRGQRQRGDVQRRVDRAGEVGGIDAGAAVEGLARDRLRAALVDRRVVAIAAVQRVDPVAAGQRVVADATIQAVVAGAAQQLVVAIGPDERVVAVAARERVVLPVAAAIAGQAAELDQAGAGSAAVVVTPGMVAVAGEAIVLAARGVVGLAGRPGAEAWLGCRAGAVEQRAGLGPGDPEPFALGRRIAVTEPGPGGADQGVDEGLLSRRGDRGQVALQPIQRERCGIGLRRRPVLRIGDELVEVPVIRVEDDVGLGGVAEHEVVAVAAIHVVGAEATGQGLVAAAADQRIVAGAAGEVVGAVAAEQAVVAAAAGQHVVAEATIQRVVAVAAVQRVVAKGDAVVRQAAELDEVGPGGAFIVVPASAGTPAEQGVVLHAAAVAWLAVGPEAVARLGGGAGVVEVGARLRPARP